MDTKEIKNRQIDLQAEIAQFINEKIQAFKVATGVAVEEIDLELDQAGGGERGCVVSSVICELDMDND